ncbi:hypothetical protein MLD38_037962 [Melastoma candidum]|uniref:Uncharacterized protein n=1 Tax=Melastoma candidum TaxID=119954 RepID=A0ACB9KYU9_9MYRT|nr:hypothetical protein MLD38_037962 [Melastoma candidum]
MRGHLGRKLPNPNSFLPACRHSFSTFDPSGGGGGGRGRGRGVTGAPTPFSPPPPPAQDDERRVPPPGIGHGRGIPPPPSNFGSPIGRGRGGPVPGGPSKPIFFKREDSVPPPTMGHDSSPDVGQGRGSGRGMGLPSSISSVLEEAGLGKGGGGDGSSSLPESITSVLQGGGRGKPVMRPKPEGLPVQEENRHLRVRPQPPSGRAEGPRRGPGMIPRGREDGGGGGSVSRGRGRGVSARGGRGRLRGRGGGRGFREFRDRGGEEVDADEGYAAGLYLGDNADGEKLAERIGPENMNKLVEGFEEMSEYVLPSPTHEMYLDAFHTNCLIEFEPEYLVEFENPDIDEKPIMPLRDVLEKVKPFLMVYEGIQNQEEWEETVKETMDRVPLIQEIIDYYSGPDRITAKTQTEELERVAKTLPESAPASVKRFTDRAVLSLKSNPGWGFDKKCMFMDQLVREVF